MSNAQRGLKATNPIVIAEQEIKIRNGLDRSFIQGMQEKYQGANIDKLYSRKQVDE
jgi:hypothetical protein